MSADPLASLVRLRKRALDDAQRVLVKCLNEEAEAQQNADAAERTIARETAAAADPEGPDAAVEAFAKWLPGARRMVEGLRHNAETSAAETARARAGVTACRTALESVETLQAERRSAQFQARERALQLELEDHPPAEPSDDGAP